MANYANLITKIASPAPAAKQVSLRGLEDQQLVLSAKTFALSSALSIRIDTLTDAGSLLYKNSQGVWQPVSVGMEFNATQLRAGYLKFAPTANQFGTNYAQFNYSVKNGDTYSLNQGQVKISIKAVNDAPVALNNTVEISKTGLTHIEKSAFTYTDVDSPSITRVKITSLSNSGSLFIQNPITHKLTALKAGAIIKTADLDHVYAKGDAIKTGDAMSFKFTVYDGQTWSSSKQAAVMTLHLPDPSVKSVIIGGTAGELQEDHNVSNNQILASGTLLTNKPGEANLFVTSTLTNDYGTFHIDTHGNWTFTANNNATIINQLNGLDRIPLQFTVTTVDNVVGNVHVTLIGANDAPAFVSYQESIEFKAVAQQTEPAITQVSSLLSTTDVDNNNVKSIALLSADTSNGTWAFSSDDGSSWTPIASVSNSAALLLNASDYIKFIPNDPNFSGQAAISFCAWDQSTGTAHAYVSVNQSDSTSAFSSQTATTLFKYNAGDDQITVDIATWDHTTPIDGGAGNDTVRLTNSSQSSDNVLTLDDLMLFKNIENITLADNRPYSIQMPSETSVSRVDASSLDANTPLTLDASSMTQNLTITAIVLSNDSHLFFGSGTDTLQFNNSSILVDSSFNQMVSGLENLILTGNNPTLTVSNNDNLIKFISASTGSTIVNVNANNVTYVAGPGGDILYVSNTYTNTVIETTAANFNYPIIIGYANNVTVRMLDQANGQVNYFTPTNHPFFDPSLYSVQITHYNKIEFTNQNDNTEGAHYYVSLPADYAGHYPNTSGITASGYLTYSLPLYLNYDASALDSHDSIVVDARDFAAAILNPSAKIIATNIAILGGDGSDMVYLPNFDIYSYKSGSHFVVNDNGISSAGVKINLGAGDDTFVLSVEKFSSVNNKMLYDGGADTAGSGSDGLGHGDTLKIEGANREINLSDIGKYFANIEQVDLGSNHDNGTGQYTFTLTLNSMLNLSGTRDDLVIRGGSDDHIKLADSANWTQKADVEISGQNYHVYASSANENQKIYVQSDIIIDLS